MFDVVGLKTTFSRFVSFRATNAILGMGRFWAAFVFVMIYFDVCTHAIDDSSPHSNTFDAPCDTSDDGNKVVSIPITVVVLRKLTCRNSRVFYVRGVRSRVVFFARLCVNQR